MWRGLEWRTDIVLCLQILRSSPSQFFLYVYNWEFATLATFTPGTGRIIRPVEISCVKVIPSRENRINRRKI